MLRERVVAAPQQVVDRQTLRPRLDLFARQTRRGDDAVRKRAEGRKAPQTTLALLRDLRTVWFVEAEVARQRRRWQRLWQQWRVRSRRRREGERRKK